MVFYSIRIRVIIYFSAFFFFSNQQDTKYHRDRIYHCSVLPLMRLISVSKFVDLSSPIPLDWPLRRRPPVDPWCDVPTRLAGVLSWQKLLYLTRYVIVWQFFNMLFHFSNMLFHFWPYTVVNGRFEIDIFGEKKLMVDPWKN